MQYSKIKLVIGVMFLSMQCFAVDSFEEAMKKHRGTSLTHIPEVKDGVSFFIPKTLTPTWEEGSKYGIVKVPKMSLKNHRGNTFSQKNFEGKKTIITFFFSSCRGFCPMLISKLKSLEKELSKNGELQFVAISVDPEIDSVEMLATYAKSHRHAQMKNWHFVTGNKDSIYELIRDTFASEVKRIESDDMRKFAHSEQFYIIDPKLRLRGVVNGTKVKLINKARVITSGI